MKGFWTTVGLSVLSSSVMLALIVRVGLHAVGSAS
jgi:hypothetical protein